MHITILSLDSESKTGILLWLFVMLKLTITFQSWNLQYQPSHNIIIDGICLVCDYPTIRHYNLRHVDIRLYIQCGAKTSFFGDDP